MHAGLADIFKINNGTHATQFISHSCKLLRTFCFYLFYIINAETIYINKRLHASYLTLLKIVGRLLSSAIYLEVICGRKYVYVQCKNAAEKIRVHDVIYGHVVGRNECNTQPTSNCTATNGFCEVAEKTEGRRGEWLHPTQTINPPPCGGTGIYIIIDYSCLKDDITLPGKSLVVLYTDSIHFKN